MLPLSDEISDETLLIVFDIFDSYIVLVFGYQMKYSFSGRSNTPRSSFKITTRYLDVV